MNKDTATVASTTINIRVGKPNIVETIKAREMAATLKREVIYRIRFGEIGIKDILTTYLYVDDMRDVHEERLRELTLDELQEVFTKLWYLSPECTYPDYDDMIHILLRYVDGITMHKYFYTNAQIQKQFEEYLNTLEAVSLLNVYDDIVLGYIKDGDE